MTSYILTVSLCCKTVSIIAIIAGKQANKCKTFHLFEGSYISMDCDGRSVTVAGKLRVNLRIWTHQLVMLCGIRVT